MNRTTILNLLSVFGLALALSLLFTNLLGGVGAQEPEPITGRGDISAAADVSSKISYQGVLEEDGQPVTGNRDITFRLYSDSGCTIQVGGDIPKNVAVANGLFSVLLDIDQFDVNGQGLWLRAIVDATNLGCQEIVPTLYALSLKPGAVVSGSVNFGSDPYGGAILKLINDSARGIYVESANQDGVVGVGGNGNNDFGGEFLGWGGIRTLASTGPGVLADDNAGVTSTENQHPGDVVASDDLIADDALVLGSSATSGDIIVRDVNGVETINVNGGGGNLRLGGQGADGDLTITNNGPTNTLRFNGQTGQLLIFDGVGTGVTNRIFEFDPADADGPAIWGDQTRTAAPLVLKSNWDVEVHLDEVTPVSTAWFRVFNDSDTEACRIEEDGDLICTGAKSAVVETATEGPRKLYAIESSEVVFEDFGSAQLVNGQAVVTIEPLFAETVNLNVDYQVYLTPVDGWAALYVTNKTATSFEVRDDEGNSNLAFDYRIVAKRSGYENVRLESFDRGLDRLAAEQGGGGRPDATMPEVEESEEELD